MTDTTLTPDRVAYETLRLIETEPERHDQGRWMTVIDDNPCETRACVAGHAAVIAGLVQWRADAAPNGNWCRTADGVIMDANMHDDAYLSEDAAYDESDAWFDAGMTALSVPEMLATLLFDASVPTETVKAVLYELAYGTDHDTITLRLDATFTRGPSGIGSRRSAKPYIAV